MDENKEKKRFIKEDDITTLLHRYTATTILTLLQEVAHLSSQSERIDWDQLVAKTTTGITNAREYQMLWRHLAYREPLPDKLNDIARPVDVDSDYEYDVEVTPPVTADISREAAACVKVLIASGLPSDTSHRNGATVKAPRTTVAATAGEDHGKKPAMAARRKRQKAVK